MPSTSLAGSGDAGSPFLIKNAADLSYMQNQVNTDGTIAPSGGGNAVTAKTAQYRLTDDIVLGYWQDIDGNDIVDDGEIFNSASGGAAYTTSNWTPIGPYEYGKYFSGTFNSNDHTVRRIYINNNLSYQGLFGAVTGTVKNLGAAENMAAKVRYSFTLSTTNGVRWASSDDSIISVSENTAALKNDGSVTLTASLQGFTKSVTLTVSEDFVKAYTLTVSAGAGGSITPSGTVVVNGGGSQTFNIKASPGYRISAVMIGGVNQGAIESYTFTDVTADHTIRAPNLRK